MIRAFKEWLTDYFSEYEVENEIGGQQYTNMEDAYNAGIKAASDHFEEEKIKIHEYYAEHINLLTEHQSPKGTEENGGKLT